MICLRLMLLCLIAATSANAATHEDAVAGFTIDMPDGYALDSRQTAAGSTILTFKRGGSSPIVISALPYEAGYEDNEEVFESLLVEPMQEVFGGTLATRELNEMDISGMPARWGWLEANANLAGLGVVELDDGFVSFSVALSEDRFEGARQELERAFFSIRMHGDMPGEVTALTAIERTVVADAALLQPSTYEHPLFTVDLPAGWEGTTSATDAKKIYLASIGGPTSTITVLCMSGMLASHKVIGDVMQTSLSGNLPNLRQTGTDKVKVANGKRAMVTSYKGQTEAQGETVVLDGLTASVKNRKCMLGFIAIGPETDGGEGIGTVMEIVQSVR